MTMPSIADVKKAAERIDECLDKAFSEDVEPQTSDLETLLEFTLSVLNAPGLSAERLAEIQRDCDGSGNHPLDCLVTPDDCRELLAEVLRLRAGVTADGEE